MTANELIKFQGKKGTMQADGFRFGVRVLDSREVNRKLEHLIEPISGQGQNWVPSWLLTLEAEPPPPDQPQPSPPTHTHERKPK